MSGDQPGSSFEKQASSLQPSPEAKHRPRDCSEAVCQGDAEPRGRVRKGAYCARQHQQLATQEMLVPRAAFLFQNPKKRRLSRGRTHALLDTIVAIVDMARPVFLIYNRTLHVHLCVFTHAWMDGWWLDG